MTQVQKMSLIKTSTEITDDKKAVSMDSLFSNPEDSIQRVRIFIAMIVLALIICILVYVISLTFNFKAFFLVTILVLGILSINPGIIDHLLEQTSVQYYCIFFAMFLLFSIEHCKKNNSLVMLLLSAILMTMLSFYLRLRIILVISMFMNLYLIVNLLFGYLGI